MFERYTEKARRAIFFARYEASLLGAQMIEAEHILLGLLREDRALAERCFPAPHADTEAIRRAIEVTAPTHDKASASVDLPLAPAAKRVLIQAATESDRLGDRHIGNEHLLLGLLGEAETLAAQLLAERGVTAERVLIAVKGEAVAASEAGEVGPGETGVLPEAMPSLLRFFRQCNTLVQVLIERGVISREDGIITQVEGAGGRNEGRTGFGWSSTRVNFAALLDVLVRKGVISEEDKQRISEVGM